MASVQCGGCGERVWGAPEGKGMMDLARFGSFALEGAWTVSGEWIPSQTFAPVPDTNLQHDPLTFL